MVQPLGVHPAYSLHSSLSVGLNRSKFLSAHCARIISHIIWLDMGPFSACQAFKGSPCATDGTLAAIVDEEYGNKCSKYYARIVGKWNYAPKYYARIMRAWVFIMRDIMRNIMRGAHLLCAILCAAPATLQYIMRGLCAPVFYYARHYAQHYARTAHIMREILILHSALPGCLRRLPYACPTTPPLSTHIMARLSQPMLQPSDAKVKLRRA